MSVKLEWQVDVDEDDELAWKTPVTNDPADLEPEPRFDGLERHPELLRLWIGSRAGRENPGQLFLYLGLALFGLLVALYIFI